MKHMEEMKIAGLAMALCIVMLGIYIVVPKDGTTSHVLPYCEHSILPDTR